MKWRGILITAAVIAAVCVAVGGYLRSVMLAEASHLGDLSSDNMDLMLQKPPFEQYLFVGHNFGEDCYPFRWQTSQRERLHYVLGQSSEPSLDTDEIALAKIVRYAEQHDEEAVVRAGLRREPHNALYHYLLADMWIKQGLKGKYPDTDKKTGEPQYHYTITDRAKLDPGMHELAIGLQLPFNTHRGALLRAQLAAMPPTRDYLDLLHLYEVLAAVQFPEYAKIRNFERVNGFYLSVLLSEGKRAEAEPFLHTGERLVIQTANDTPATLIGQLVAIAVGEISEKWDVHVCRKYGLTREADEIAAHQALLIGKLKEWHQRGRKIGAKEQDALIADHGGILAAILLPIFGPQHSGLITKASLTPSRLVEYVMMERAEALGLCLFAAMLLLYAGLKYWRWKLIMRGAGQPVALDLTAAEWRRVLGYGLAMPLLFYLLFIALPFSGREHAVIHALPSGIALIVFSIWMLLVPSTLAAGYLRRHAVAAELLVVARVWPVRWLRLLGALGQISWVLITLPILLLSVCWTLLTPVLAHTPFSSYLEFGLCWLLALLALAVLLLPVFWERRKPEAAPFHRAIARAMLPVYAVMTLFFAALVPVCAGFERHYLQIDTVMAPMVEGDDVAFTMVEGKVVQMLRQDVRDGATVLHIPWR